MYTPSEIKSIFDRCERDYKKAHTVYNTNNINSNSGYSGSCSFISLGKGGKMALNKAYKVLSNL